MSKVYAEVAETGENVLVRIECDYCEAAIKPQPHITESGWKQWGLYFAPLDDRNTQMECCPECVDMIPLEAI